MAALGLLAGCKRHKPPAATRVWLGPAGGCADAVNGLACWGPSVASPFDPGGKVKELALGEKHGCAVLAEGGVKCWGGDTTAEPAADAVAIGGKHTCVRARDRLRCFGSDDEGQLGGEWPTGSIRAFALGDAHTCVAYANQGVLCRGRGASREAEPLLGGAVVKGLAAGSDHTCALLEDETVRCWGKNDAGQLGDGSTSDAKTPVTVVGLGNVYQIAAGSRHTCALLRNGTVACWGDNRRHQLANGTTDRGTRPAVVVGLVLVREIALAGDGACARLDGGYLRCWGANDRGQLGDGTTEEHNVPMPIRYR